MFFRVVELHIFSPFGTRLGGWLRLCNNSKKKSDASKLEKPQLGSHEINPAAMSPKMYKSRKKFKMAKNQGPFFKSLFSHCFSLSFSF